MVTVVYLFTCIHGEGHKDPGVGAGIQARKKHHDYKRIT